MTNPELATGDVEVRATRADRRRTGHAAGDSRRARAQRESGRGGTAAAPSVPRPAPAGAAGEHRPAPPPDAGDAALFERARFLRDRDADPHEADARGRARLSRAEPRAPRRVLRAAAVAAALQAAAHGLRVRPLLPDRALLPRRGSATGSSARVHTDRHRGVVHRRRRTSCVERGARRRAVARGGHGDSRDVSAHDVRRGDGALRVGQARHAVRARDLRRERGVSRRRLRHHDDGARRGWPRPRHSRAGRRGVVAQAGRRDRVRSEEGRAPPDCCGSSS